MQHLCIDASPASSSGFCTLYVSFFPRGSPSNALSAIPTVSLTAMLSFHTPPEPTSCASTTFSWSYSGPNVPLLLQITNVGVSQDAPPPTTSSPTTTSSSSTYSSIVSTGNLERSTPNTPISSMDLAVTLVMNYNPSAQEFVWNSVNVSQGWYRLISTISTIPMTQNSSSPFFVRTGSNTSCLGLAAGILSTPTISHSPTTSPSMSSSRPATSLPASDLSSSSSSKVPTIVGVTVGIGALVIGILILWFILARRKKSRTNDGNNKNSLNRWKGLGDANAPQKRYRSSRSHLTSQPASIVSEFDDGGILGAEKNYEEEGGVALSNLPVLHHQSSRTRPDRTYSASSSSSNLNDFGGGGGGKSSLRYSTQHSIDSSAVYPPSFTVSSRDSGQHVVAPDVLRSQSLSTTNTQYSLSNSIDPISSSFPSPPSFANGETKQMNRQSIGKKRKPAPVYDPSEDEPISSTSPVFTLPPLPHSTTTTTTNMELSFPELSHKSSFGPGGIEGKQLHYLIPDMPLSQTQSR